MLTFFSGIVLFVALAWFVKCLIDPSNSESP